MANLIQIKRSTTTATPVSLANGEFAYSSNGDVLYIGANGGVQAIGGKRVPGTLTANQALVANATSGIDKVIVANLQPSGVYANGSLGTAGQVLYSNGSVVYWANNTGLTAGLGLTSNATHIYVNAGSGIVANSTGTFAKAANGISVDASGINVVAGAGLVSNTTGLFVAAGNGTIVSNTTGVYVNASALSIATSQLTGDVALGANTSGNYVATITAGSGISGSSSSEGGTPTIAVVAGGGIASNSTGVHVLAGVGTYTNTTGHGVLANNGIIANSTGTFVNGGSTLTVNATGVHVNSSLSITDLTLSGNLTVTGTLTTVDTTNLTVKDSMIELANGNQSTDSLDIGFYGQYGSTGAKYTGLFRDATDGVYKLYTGLTLEPSTTVDISNTSYTQATLQAYLSSGGLVSNSTAVTLTANSTLAVNLTANTLSLSTPLPVGSGGLGLSSITSGAILVGNGAGVATVLAAGTDGYVLQSNGTSVVYGTLDGGTF